MGVLNRFSLKKMALATAVGVATLFSAPTPAPAASLGDLFSGIGVKPGCTQFTSPFGYQVPVRYFLPAASCSSPAVVILHGIDGGTRYNSKYEEIGRGLAAKGYAAFIVYYYNGQPNVPRPDPYGRMLPAPEAFAPWVDTAKASVEFAQSFPGVDPARVGVLGLSLGGFVGTSAAANNPRVRSLAVLSGGMPDLYQERMRMMPPTLIVHGDQDPDVSVWSSLKLHDAMTRRGLWNDLEILRCEGHLPYSHSKERVAEMVVRFFDQTL